MGGHTMQRKSAHEPTFEPDVITLLDFLSKWIRKRFFGRVVTGGWAYRLAACIMFAYLYPY